LEKCEERSKRRTSNHLQRLSIQDVHILLGRGRFDGCGKKGGRKVTELAGVTIHFTNKVF